jgi:hypothetical protein
MAIKDPFEEIKKHQEAIAALKDEAVSGLKDKRKALLAEIASVEAEIEKLTGAAPTEKTRRRRSPSVAITIEQVVKEIKAGRTNNVQISKALGCSAARVKAVVAQSGKSAGVTSTGERASFVYHVKK